MDGLTRGEGDQWVKRSNAALAYVSGRLGRWLAPTFVAVTMKEAGILNRHSRLLRAMMDKEAKTLPPKPMGDSALFTLALDLSKTVARH